MSTLLFSLALSLGCIPDDVTGESGETGETGETGDTGGAEEAAIVGTWLSEGEDVSVLLGYFNIVKVDAVFSADGNYDVTSTDSDGATVNYTGTYTIDLSTEPHGIVLEQTAPEAATSRGIWAVESGTMQYEVIQDGIGYTAPTPEGGFGSSSGTGLQPGDNVQVFQVQ